MRPVASSAFRSPLDHALGSIARVRVLRELALHGGFVSVSSLVASARVDPVSARNAVRVLEEIGLVETQGGLRSRLYRLSPRDSLSGPIRQLFRKEASRWSTLEDGLRRAIRELSPRPLAAWLYGSSARREDVPQSDIDVMIVTEERHLESQSQELRDRVWKLRLPLASRANVTGMSEKDFLSLQRRQPRLWTNIKRDAIPLLGKAPDELLKELRGERK